jgi:co-chaperonin GroES (HSP10)
MGPRILIRVIKSPDRSEAGLFLPQGAKDHTAEALLGEVIEVARTQPKADSLVDIVDEEEDQPDAEPVVDFGKNVSGIPLGANVLFEKERGVAVPWDDNLRLLEVRYVLALVDIISQEEIQ